MIGREFRGHDVFSRVLADGTRSLSQRPSTEVVPLGARVQELLLAGRVAIPDPHP